LTRKNAEGPAAERTAGQAQGDHPQIAGNISDQESRQETHCPALAEPVVIARFWRNRKGEAIVVQLREYGGRAILDARVHFTTKDGRLQASKKGLSVVVARLPELAAALVQSLAKARELGLLKPDGSGHD
jgi:hypothetical protein